MNTAQHKAQVHMHPAARTTNRIFEVRRLAQEAGCTFITSKPITPRSTGPFNGGSAA